MRRLILAFAVMAGFACASPVAAHASYGTGRAHVPLTASPNSYGTGAPR